MKTAICTKGLNRLLLPTVMALLAVACGDSSVPDRTSTETNAANATTMDHPSNAGGYDANGNVDAMGGYNKDGTLYSATGSPNEPADLATNTANVGTWNTTGGYDAQGVPSDAGGYNADGTKRVVIVVTTPKQERAGALETMNAFRNVLMADLEVVRSHLNKGTLPDEHADADQERAAELAQGLARVDKALETMKETTDDNWKDLREVQLKEVNSVRSWWNGFVENQPESARR